MAPNATPFRSKQSYNSIVILFHLGGRKNCWIHKYCVENS